LPTDQFVLTPGVTNELSRVFVHQLVAPCQRIRRDNPEAVRFQDMFGVECDAALQKVFCIAQVLFSILPRSDNRPARAYNGVKGFLGGYDVDVFLSALFDIFSPGGGSGLAP